MMNQKMDGTWMTIEETATYLRCSLRYLREKVSNREIPFTRFGGKALFHRSRIDQWMFSREESGDVSGELPEQKEASQISEVDTTIQPNCDRDRVHTLVQSLIDFNEHFVTALGNNLRNDLDSSDYQNLSEKVYAQLSRWCHPRRDSVREQKVKPIVHELSKELFARVVERTKHPSYQG